MIRTFTASQNRDGGFGGGHGQVSHCAASYAAVLSLAIVGGDKALGLINRKTLWVARPCMASRHLTRVDHRWQWLSRVKQPDGGFAVTEGGEVDVR